MNEPPVDPRQRLDIRVTTPGREGLTGTAPASVYTRAADAVFSG
jgi:hypothetical protein